MKKLNKIFLIVFGFCPLILGAKTSEEVRYKFYTEVEDKVHYEKDVENNCEYFEIIDKNNFVYSDTINTSIKPESLDNRIINEKIDEIEVNRDYISDLEINYFYATKANKKIYEIEFYDNENNKINYTITNEPILTGKASNINDDDLNSYVLVTTKTKIKIHFDSLIDIKNLKINIVYENDDIKFYGIVYVGYIKDISTDAYDYNSVNKTTSCDNEKCNVMMELKNKTPSDEKISINTISYTYIDPMYKCYSLKRVYLPGYYEEAEGFIKDEESYIVEKIEDKIEENELLNQEILSIKNNYEILINEIKSIKNSEINKLDDYKNINNQLTLIMNNIKNNKNNETIIERINSISNDLNNIKYIDYTDLLKELNKSIKENIKVNNYKKEKTNDRTISLIIIVAFQLITFLVLIFIFNRIVKKSRMK